jgi:Meckel syndrome type 1 protein
MRRTTGVVLSLAFAIFLIGCSTTETNTNTNSNTTSGTTDKPAAANTPTTAAASTSGASVGVPECDDFLAKYDSCTSKVPEMMRAQYENAGKQMRDQWKKLAENPQTKGTLAAACKQAVEQQAAAWKMYGCAH